MALQGNRQLVNIPAGINKDDNPFTSLVYTDANKIRFHQGLPEKVGGWASIDFNTNIDLEGVPRTIYTYEGGDGIPRTLIGTHTRLYSYQNGQLYNITPLVTATTAIANSLATNYLTFSTDAISTTSGSQVVTVDFTGLNAAVFAVNDTVTISGVGAAIGGVPAGDFNTTHSIFNVTATTFQIVVNTEATSDDVGGNGAVLATKTVTVSQATHGFADGDRIKILAATTFGGLAAADLNVEGIVRYINANSYCYYLTASTNYATSSASAGGGASTTVQGQIAAGNCTFSQLEGYGAGPYGSGPYSIGSPVTGTVTFPRIWSIDRYDDGVVLTPGNNGAVYEWDGDVTVAPTIVTNSPTVNYLFVAHAENQIVTFGDTDDNRVHTSDVDDITTWTAASDNVVFNRKIDGASRLIGHAYVSGQYLLFTQDAVYTMRFVDKPDIYIIQQLTNSDGLIGQWAVTNVADAVVWMGQTDFYIYDGGSLRSIPNNNLVHWIFDTLDAEKSFLTFTWYLENFDEIWWFFPSDDAEANEPDTYVIWNYEENHWTNGTLTRTAAERSVRILDQEYLATGSCDESIATALYLHEFGYADDGANMEGSLTTNYTLIGDGDYIQQISNIIPSNLLIPTGTVNNGEVLYTITVNTKEYDQSSNTRQFGPYSVYATTSKVDTRIVGRQRQYVYNFDNQIGFRIQKTFETMKPFTVR